MANNAIETVMGAVVLAVAGGFLYFAYSNSNVKPIEGYAISASFSNISGITAGSSVRVGGIKVGVVESLDLDPKSFQAIAKMRIQDTIKLPRDSSAAVQSAGLLGEKFLALEPGGDEENLGNGDKIAFTQPSVSLEEMIGKFVFSGGGADKAAAGEKPAASHAASSDIPSLSDEAAPEEKPVKPSAAEPKIVPHAAKMPAAVVVPAVQDPVGEPEALDAPLVSE